MYLEENRTMRVNKLNTYGAPLCHHSDYTTVPPVPNPTNSRYCMH